MVPKYGGDPLPLSPICMPREHVKARAYVIEIEAALTRVGWSKGQRGRLRALHRLWLLRAEGRDAQFEKYGSIGRCPGSRPPTATDVTTEVWRRLAPRSKEERKRRKMPWRIAALGREKNRYS